MGVIFYDELNISRSNEQDSYRKLCSHLPLFLNHIKTMANELLQQNLLASLGKVKSVIGKTIISKEKRHHSKPKFLMVFEKYNDV